MSALPRKTTRIALPCAFTSILTTSALLKALSSSNDKGLTTMSKGLGLFLIVLGLAVVVTRTRLHTTTPTANEGVATERLRPMEDELVEAEARELDTVVEISGRTERGLRRDGVLEIGHGCTRTTTFCSVEEGSLGTDKRAGAISQRRGKEKESDKKKDRRVRTMLAKVFKPRKSTLLGERKEEAVTVVDYDPI
jgi:hypothetical protein